MVLWFVLVGSSARVLGVFRGRESAERVARGLRADGLEASACDFDVAALDGYGYKYPELVHAACWEGFAVPPLAALLMEQNAEGRG